MKNLRILFTLTVVSILTIPSCQTIQVDIQADKDAIRELDSTWSEAIQDQDIENVMNLMAPDAVFMIDDLPIIEGQEAIREAQLNWYADTSIDFSSYRSELVDIEVSISGDMAYTRGREHYNIISPEGTIENWSKWVDIWKKIDGKWKVMVVIGNSDNP